MKNKPNTIREPARDIPVFGEYDVVVCGGGPAGCAAAIAAARHGARTLLVEKDGYLGGATVSQLEKDRDVKPAFSELKTMRSGDGKSKGTITGLEPRVRGRSPCGNCGRIAGGMKSPGGPPFPTRTGHVSASPGRPGCGAAEPNRPATGRSAP